MRVRIAIGIMLFLTWFLCDAYAIVHVFHVSFICSECSDRTFFYIVAIPVKSLLSSGFVFIRRDDQ